MQRIDDLRECSPNEMRYQVAAKEGIDYLTHSGIVERDGQSSKRDA